MMRRVDTRADDGVALVLGLIFLVLVGLFLTVALEKNQSTSLTGQAIRDHTQLQYALDGAVEEAWRSLRVEMQSGTPTSCTSSADSDGTGSLTLNSKTSNYVCRTVAGRAATSGDTAARNFALLVTSPNSGALETQAGSSADLDVAGSIYFNGRVENSDLNKVIKMTSGDLVGPLSRAGCDDDLDDLTDIEFTGTGQLRACTEQTLSQAMPTVALPGAPTVNLVPLLGSGIELTVAGGGKCQVYFPGLYQSRPTLKNNGKHYFVSGLYYFNFTSGPSWVVDDANVEIVAGARGVATDTDVPPNSCATMTDAAAMSALAADATLAALGGAITPYTFPHGATWVFGGTSSLEIKKGSLTMFTPPTGGSTMPVNFVGASSFTPPSYAAVPTGNSVLLGGGSNAVMQLNAKLFAPTARVEIFSTNATIAAVRGGVVAYEILLKASAAGSDALAISAPAGSSNPPPPFRTVVVEATDGSGSSSVKQRAVAKISNFAPYSVTVLSWRTL